jgi:hypothetical protein
MMTENNFSRRPSLWLAIRISELNYESAIRRLLPFMLKEASGWKHAEPFVDVLSASSEFTGNALAAALETLPKNLKDELAVRGINEFGQQLVSLLISFSLQKGLRISADHLTAETNGSDLSVSVEIWDIYEPSAIKILQSLYNRQKSGTKSGLLNRLAACSVRLAMMTLSRQKLYELTASAVNEYSRQISDALEKYLRAQNIELCVSSVKAATVGPEIPIGCSGADPALAKTVQSDAFYLSQSSCCGHEEVALISKGSGKRTVVITGEGRFAEFPGVTLEDSWSGQMGSGSLSPEVKFRMDFESTEDNRWLALWTVQPDGRYWEDDEGFGGNSDSEIVLYSYLAQNGAFVKPFQVYRVGIKEFWFLYRFR